MPNRLAKETSPYLQQHQDNPVDWYPWGDEAFTRARTENKPILLSVGYSACHWCHVMEHESFADAETAELMNREFVSVKVDREERPDVDSLYMQAIQQLTGHGGWPMTVFLTPEGAPFYGGTYFPPEPRHGLPSFKQILLGVAQAFDERRDEVDRSATELTRALAEGMSVNPSGEDLDEALVDRAFQRLAVRFDHQNAGFGGAPKFPQPMLLDFLLQYWLRTASEGALRMVERTLEQMAAGGMYDQVGGGFHRYSVDAHWFVPHFEKMLYDNAQLSGVYLHAYQVTKRQDFRLVTEQVLDYVLREMRSPAGGFYSSQDADSEGVEGKFYVWSASEIDSLLGSEEGPVFRRLFGVTEGGNWEGSNILFRAESVEELAAERGTDPSATMAMVERAREVLYADRSKRVWPGRDGKVVASWNAMMMRAFAEAGRVLAREEYLQAAVDSAEFMLNELMDDRRLLRTWRDGSAKIGGFLEDYALGVDALVEVYSANFDLRWVERARDLADRMIEAFWSEDEGVFYDTSAGGEQLVVRPRDIYDNATPSGTSAAVHALIRLGRLVGEPRYERIAGRVLRGMSKIASDLPQGFGNLLAALQHFLASPTEVAIVGPRQDEHTAALLRTLHQRYLPHTTLAFLDIDDDTARASAAIPLLSDRPMRNGRATAYVCRHYTCKQPVTEPAALDLDLSTLHQPGSSTTA